MYWITSRNDHPHGVDRELAQKVIEIRRSGAHALIELHSWKYSAVLKRGAHRLKQVIASSLALTSMLT